MNYIITYFGGAVKKSPYEIGPVYKRKFWEFQLVYKGKIGPRMSDTDEIITYRANTLFISHPDLAYSWSCPEGTSASILVIHFHNVPDIIKEMCKKHQQLKIPMSKSEISSILSWHKEVDPYFRNPNSHSFYFYNNYLYNLITLILKKQKSKKISPYFIKPTIILQQAMNYYITNLSRNPTVKEVREYLNISEKYLRNITSQVFNMSPQELLIHLKIERIEELLSTTNMTLDKIAQAVGFSEKSPMIRIYKRKKNLNPGEYRKQIKA